MTPTERTTALRQIGWSQRDLARALGVAEGTVRYWQSERRTAPERVDAWLEALASRCFAHTQAADRALEARAAIWAAHPPPERVAPSR